MSLLAGPRRRQIISRNPQGKNQSELWKEFGTKLMEKSGWTEGDGLGSGRAGGTEPLQMQFKDDNRGLGCTIQYENNWLAHGDDFNALLANLNAHHAEPAGEEKQDSEDAAVRVGLEKKSKGAKGRIHYHKFTRGKDLSTRSTDEISKIFGGNVPSSKSARDAVKQELLDDSVPKEEKVTGLKTFQSTESMHDYFAKKMALKKGTGFTPSASANVSPDSSGVSTRDVSPVRFQQQSSSSVITETVHVQHLSGTDSPSNRKKAKHLRDAVSSTDQAMPDIKVETDVPTNAGLGMHPDDAAMQAKAERRLQRKLRKAALENASSTLPCAVDPDTATDTNRTGDNSGQSEQLIESREARRARKLARREKKQAELEAATSSADSTSVDARFVKETMPVVHVTGTAVLDALPPGASDSFPRPTFGTSMHHMRQLIRSIAPEARAAMFPGSNLFQIVGYGDEHFFR